MTKLVSSDEIESGAVMARLRQQIPPGGRRHTDVMTVRTHVSIGGLQGGLCRTSMVCRMGPPFRYSRIVCVYKDDMTIID